MSRREARTFRAPVPWAFAVAIACFGLPLWAGNHSAPAPQPRVIPHSTTSRNSTHITAPTQPRNPNTHRDASFRPVSQQLLPQQPLPAHRTSSGGRLHAPDTSAGLLYEVGDRAQQSGPAPFADVAVPIHTGAVAMPAQQPGELDRDPQWWDEYRGWCLRNDTVPLEVDVESLILSALQHSPRILALRTEPQIRQLLVPEELAEFDWRTFLETRYLDLNEPVGNLLTTGGPDRFRDQHWTSAGGLRQRNELGGQLEAAQRWGWQDTNSRFFVPSNQGTTRLELNYTQPLLSRSGKLYNQSRIVLASLESDSSRDDLLKELQEHLLNVTDAYWELYRARSELVQRQMLLAGAEEILRLLQARRNLDVEQRLILRAQAAVANRRSEIARGLARIKNAESLLRLLVSAPQLTQQPDAELVTLEAPAPVRPTWSTQEAVQIALLNRPDISRGMRRIRATAVRLQMSESEALPKLDLVLGAYVAGLAGQSDVAGAWGDQFAEGRPTYSGGLVFEVPFGNRGAQAQRDRRELEFQKAMHELRATISEGVTETELAVREVETCYAEIQSRRAVLAAASSEAKYLEERWRVLPGIDNSSIFLLEDLLDAQERLADAERELVLSETRCVMAVTRIRKAMGTLLHTRGEAAPAARAASPVTPDTRSAR